METDTELVERWSAGEQRAGELIFERHYGCISRFFYNKVNPNAVPDLVQKTFLRCIEKFAGKRPETTFKNYLFGVARMILLEHFRRLRRHEDRLDPLVVSAVDLAPSPGSILGRRQEVQLMLQALRRLPIDYQIVLELYFWEKLRAAAVAEIIGVPEGTARSRIRRARQLFAAEVEALTTDPDLRSSTVGGVEEWVAQVRAALSD
ncbi:MAG: sigma-70 family RNA polymerase sigma factor [Nannocystaceae bacterium]